MIITSAKDEALHVGRDTEKESTKIMNDVDTFLANGGEIKNFDILGKPEVKKDERDISSLMSSGHYSMQTAKSQCRKLGLNWVKVMKIRNEKMLAIRENKKAKS